MHTEKMTLTERNAVVSLSSIMGLRMIGLFMVLPVFSLYAQQLTGATPFWVGVAIGIYGLAQALCQIPFGALSDRIGRKPIITIGLLIFAIGSLLAAFSHSIFFMIIGRALQGMGAVGSTILAFVADLTREEQRTKAMAMAGITIGLSFSIAMFLGPLLTQWITVNQLFLLASLLGLTGIFILYRFTPVPHSLKWHRETEPELKSFLTLLTFPELAKLNSGIFILHAIFTASFMVIPLSLQQFAHLETSQQWLVYLPALLIAFIISFACIGLSERKKRLKPFFLGSILLLIAAEIIFWQAPQKMISLAMGTCLFFTGFSILEAFLPSLVSRTAPAGCKGSALGIYSCAQFLGIFVGGALGGWLYGTFSFPGVYFFCIFLALFWLSLAFLMQPPRYLVTRTLHLPSKESDWHAIIARLKMLPGMVDLTFIAEDKTVYLKMEKGTIEHPDFIRLKEYITAIN